jgi:excisionase family DNA binding protein
MLPLLAVKKKLTFNNVPIMDIYFELKEIKERQDKMLSILNDLLSENSQERIYDLHELGERFKVSKRTMATWIQQGILPHTKVGGKIWVTETQLKAFLEKYSNDPYMKKSQIQKGRSR